MEKKTIMDEVIKVGICIPTYESPDLLKRAINSIFEQTYTNYEVFISDDSQTDSVCNYLSSIDTNKIVYRRNEKQIGASGNTNRALQMAIDFKVDYIKILFQDDWFTYSDSLEKYVRRIMESDAEVLFSGNGEDYPDRKPEHICTREVIERIQNDVSELFRANLLGAPSNIMFKTGDFLFDTQFTWLLDTDFYLSILRERSFEYIAEPLIMIGHDGNQLSDYYYNNPMKRYYETKRQYKKYAWLHTEINKNYLVEMKKQCRKECYMQNKMRLVSKVHSVRNILGYVKYLAYNKFKNIKIRMGIRLFLRNKDEQETRPLLDYIKSNKLTYFNYDWFHKYSSAEDFPILKDSDGRLFIFYNGHNMYFKKEWDKERIREYLDSLLPEQDERSPHLYFGKGEKRDQYGAVIDAGVAEGMFALEVIDRTERLYLIECDDEWLEAIEKTMSPFKEKVVVIPKLLGNIDDDMHCTLDSIIKSELQVDLIKMDIEGAEMDALRGCKKEISKINEFLICTYHYQEEESDIRSFFSAGKESYSIHAREGYMFFMHELNQKYPYLRKGVLRIQKE